MDVIKLLRQAEATGGQERARNLCAAILNKGGQSEETLAAARWLLENGGDYRLSYTAFVRLFNADFRRDEILNVMIPAFYEPNVKAIEKRYRRNCNALKDYPYLFRKDFLPFEELPIVFFPYDNDGYAPLDTRKERFLDYINPKIPVVSRNFFRDLENPILADDVFSQYELEYLRDNVRSSERVGRENHIYLHYPDWALFCSWLQVLDFRPLLEGKKFVFLIGEEKSLYPIDFAERFGIDYSRYPARPIAIREINKLIWHTQLSSHNGGDFFNEVFDDHPNLISITSVFLETIEERVAALRSFLRSKEGKQIPDLFAGRDSASHWIRELYEIRRPTDKDLMVALFLSEQGGKELAPSDARIAPAIFFQPHFDSMTLSVSVFDKENVVLRSEEMDRLYAFKPFREFRYIKTMIPLRRFTTSYAATMRFISYQPSVDEKGRSSIFYTDIIMDRIFGRHFMRDPEDRLFRDGAAVRFEDGKLNPKATFTRLAGFLDIPYTDSMTYCSEMGERNPVTIGNAVGFDPAPVFRTYDEFISPAEGAYLEYFLRDAYAFYGYDFHYYDGTSVDESRVAAWAGSFDTLNRFMRERLESFIERQPLSRDGEIIPEETVSAEEAAALRRRAVDERMQYIHEQRLRNASVLLRNPRFVSKEGRPLEMTPLLEPDPNLLDAPLYR